MGERILRKEDLRDIIYGSAFYAGMTFSDESVNTVRGMIEEARSHGKDLRYIYSGEQGGANTMLAPYTAAILNLPLLDTDANGRAVPELNTGLAPIHQIPTSPVVMASGKGDLMVLRTEDPLDSSACESLGRQMSDLYRGIGFSAGRSNGSIVQRIRPFCRFRASKACGDYQN